MKSWSRNHDQCVHCQRTDRRHEGKGFCFICYPHYRDPYKAYLRKKRYQLRMSDEQVTRQQEQTKSWKEQNRARVLEYGAAWRAKNRAQVQA